jgi:hypothetical protein
LVKLEDWSGDWAAAIGKAFVAFGGIEHVTVACLRTLPKDNLQKSTKSFRLGQRIDLLIEILEPYEKEPYKVLSKHLDRAKALAETRNLIAHNPLVLEFYERPDGSIYHEQVIAAMHKDKKVTLQELQAFADECEALVTELYAASSEVFRLHRSKSGA